MGLVLLVSNHGQYLGIHTINDSSENNVNLGHRILTGEEFVPEPSKSPVCRPHPLEDW